MVADMLGTRLMKRLSDAKSVKSLKSDESTLGTNILADTLAYPSFEQGANSSQGSSWVCGCAC